MIRLDKVLIVSGSTTAAKSLSDLLGTGPKQNVTVSTNSGEARRILSSKEFDMIIINSPLTDDLGSDLAVFASESTLAGIMFIVKADIYRMVAARLEDYGIMVIEKPLNRNLFSQSLRLVKATQNRMRSFRQENVKLKNQIAEMRLTDRAKAVLMDYLKLSEPQAHRFIVKQAMDMRMTKMEVAQNILKTYDK